MTLESEQVLVDTSDPVGSDVGGRRPWSGSSSTTIRRSSRSPAPDRLPGILFSRVPEPKTLKNRLHLDFRPDDQDAAVARLLDLGATVADIGQGEQTWVVLQDPEGNEFCVLRAHTPEERARSTG